MENETTKIETKSEAQELLAFAEELKQKKANLVAKNWAIIEAAKAELKALGVIRVRKSRAIGRPKGSRNKPKPEGTVGA